ncbi:TlpA family protein disulfide reductase [Chryseobacterium carnipullorum]|jgi:thiol-disulfide isomerase/thioredoxin|uniref:Thioredoxin n=3 Tax=Chryseobacterium group TaxID=2782232 RepID=A0A085BIV0_9FLAO|nr:MULTISPECIES: TlpA disulfide reductase family protein [Chryseobacterium group]AZB08366.1 TlpA family protein disulfide reductase [Chryseobacterium sp. G0162]AZA51210.1 TlpA family protein disulfide reductase [Chryseobacterium carnipullorum]AZA66061.1 TlpA family protein disulfide reductase [Chryseobacterium carnipullorum]KFC22395.1 thioredoxin [Epilithonimonas lactis]REC68562.1 TlpA family protein disulfide reductase [Epilithonimonas hispanica]
MEKFKIWLRKNWSTALLVSIFIVLLVSPDAKAWLMRQIISTGLMNSKIEEKETEPAVESTPLSSTENFSVRNDKGEIINTSDLKGKVVFINFWASWCPPCRAEFPSIQTFYVRFKSNKDLVFLTVNLDEQTALGKMYLEKEQFTVPFLVAEGSIPTAFFNGSLPTTVVLDRSGKIRMHHAGMADYSKESFYQEINQLLNEK